MDPCAPVRRTAEQFLAHHPELADEDLASPRVGRWIARLSAPLAAYFRFRLDGLERVPAATERWFGFKAVPLTCGMLLFWALALAWLGWPWLWPAVLAAFAQAFVPLPTRIEGEVLPPMTPRPDETDAETALRVEAAMQAAMDRLAARRRTPWG